MNEDVEYYVGYIEGLRARWTNKTSSLKKQFTGVAENGFLAGLNGQKIVWPSKKKPISYISSPGYNVNKNDIDKHAKLTFEKAAKILGVTKKPTKEQIKKAYREKVKIIHPDVWESPHAEVIFREINAAYDYLNSF